MPPLDFALGLGVHGCPTRMLHTLVDLIVLLEQCHHKSNLIEHAAKKIDYGNHC